MKAIFGLLFFLATVAPSWSATVYHPGDKISTVVVLQNVENPVSIRAVFSHKKDWFIISDFKAVGRVPICCALTGFKYKVEGKIPEDTLQGKYTLREIRVTLPHMHLVLTSPADFSRIKIEVR